MSQKDILPETQYLSIPARSHVPPRESHKEATRARARDHLVVDGWLVMKHLSAATLAAI